VDVVGDGVEPMDNMNSDNFVKLNTILHFVFLKRLMFLCSFVDVIITLMGEMFGCEIWFTYASISKTSVV
jgi:hypothetical protein